MNTHEKYQLIIKDYLDGVTLKEIAQKYGYKHKTAIHGILKKYNILLRTNQWSKEQIQQLKQYYPYESWDFLLNLFNNRTRDEITHKASKLKIKRENYHYDEWENNILLEYYENTPIKEIQKMIPHRSEYSIQIKANKLGLNSRLKWTVDESEKLKNLYPYYSNKELLSFFSNRTISAIQSQSKVLGIDHKSYNYRSKEFSKEFLIEQLKWLANKLGRTPHSLELNLYEEIPSSTTYQRYFNGYYNACIEANLDINPSMFRSDVMYKSKNDDVCLSKAELIITDFFIDNNINYKKEVYYADLIDDERCGFKRCDWLLDDMTIVEYFGMADIDFYKVKMDEKISICNDNNINLIDLYVKDLNRLKTKFLPYIK